MTTPNNHNQNQGSHGRHDNDFYEAMPAAMDRFYLPDVTDIAPDQSETEHDYTKEARTTAIITLVITLLIAVALGIVFVRGLDTIKNSVPATDSSGSLEM